MNTSSRTPVLRSALLKTILSPLLLPLLAALVPQEATALNRYYDPTLGGCTGIYSNPGCWTAGAVPGAGDTPFFNNNGLSYTTQSTASLTHANVYVYFRYRILGSQWHPSFPVQHSLCGFDRWEDWPT